jgi:CubicO group peptidase (beta-lactamase class C family)
MMFDTTNMASFAASHPLEQPPGTKWNYSSGSSNILSGIVFRATGGTLKGMTRFAQDRLFKPAGMTSALIEADESGILVGSSYAYATARDWARFGQMFLDHGSAGGKQVVSRKWVDFVQTPTPASQRPLYGGQFWLNQGDEDGAKKRMYRDLPTDMYMALGHNAQIIAIIPSHDAVVVRLGWTPEGKSFDTNRYFSAIVAVLK